MINRQGVASRSDRSSNDDARVPDPSILTPPAGQSGDLQGTTKLECRSAYAKSILDAFRIAA